MNRAINIALALESRGKGTLKLEVQALAPYSLEVEPMMEGLRGTIAVVTSWLKFFFLFKCRLYGPLLTIVDPKGLVAI